jgi:hypothetical protein
VASFGRFNGAWPVSLPGMLEVALGKAMPKALTALAGLVIIAAAVAACGRITPSALQTPTTGAQQAGAVGPRTSAPVPRREALAPRPDVGERIEKRDEPSPAEPMQDPDPRVRRFALEQRARNPTESLDLVTTAMVDAEDSIRERAEQLFEEALARTK